MNQPRLKKIFHESLQADLMRRMPILDAVHLSEFVNRFISCFKSDVYSNKMNESPIAIILDPTRTGSGQDYLDPNIITSIIKQWNPDANNVVIVDYSGREIIDSTYGNNVIDGEDVASDLSKDHGLILFFIKQLAIKVYVNGYCVKSTDNIHSIKRSGEVYSSDLPPSQYKLLIEKHYNERLLKGKRVTYWHKKQEKILRQKPEDYFRNELHSFLQDNLTPEGIAEKEVSNASTSDLIDIRITDATSGIEFIIIEVKWMGRSISIKKNGKVGITELKEESPNAGINQLGIYLQDEPHAKCGCLVTYDARIDAENAKIVWTSPESSWHKKIDKPPMRLYIKSESASQEGKKIAKQAKKR